MSNKKIGIVTIKYDKQGKITSSIFKPTMEVKLDNLSFESLKENPNDSQEVKESADTVLASWFNEINEIELADRESYEISSEVLKCSRYKSSGVVKTCKIEYSFVKLTKKGLLN